MSLVGIPSRNALWNNSAYPNDDDDVNRNVGAADWELIHKYNSELYSIRQITTSADPYGETRTSREKEDPFTPINQARHDEEADWKPEEDEGAFVKGTGGFSQMPKTTAFQSRKLTSTSFQTTIVKHAPSSPTKIRQAYNPLLYYAEGCSRQGRTMQPAGEDDGAM